MTGAPRPAIDVARYDKPAELARLGRAHAVVEASAGTGKTYLIEHMVVDLLLRRAATLEQILVVTFTEKATAELQQRIRSKLEVLAKLTADHPAAQRAAALPDERCWIIDADARARLQAAARAFDSAAIFTIHGFCHRVLAEHAFAQGRLFEEEAVAETEAFHAAFVETIRADALRLPMCATLLEAWRRSGCTLERLERNLAAAHRKISAVSGRGGIEQRPSYAAHEEALRAALRACQTCDPTEDELRGALKRAKCHGGSVSKVVRVWNALRAALSPRQEGEDVELGEVLARLDLERPEFIGYLLKTLPRNAGEDLLDRMRAALQQLDAAAPPLLAALASTLGPALAARLEQRKRAAGLFDFQDMLTLVGRALDDGAHGAALVRTLRARYRFAIVDEFQDTDEVQWGLFRRLFFESPGGHVLTVIGDPKQSIYSFRGADVHTYNAARSAIAAAGGEALVLQTNFRSSAPLIGAYNAILDQREPAPFFPADGLIRYDHPVGCGQPDLRLAQRHAPESSAPALVVWSLRPPAEEKKLPLWRSKPVLLARMSAEIAHLTGPTGPLLCERGQLRPLRPRDIFILTRTTRECREVGEALRTARLPFAFFKLEKLFDTVEAREVLDLLRGIAAPDDGTARLRALITSFFGLRLPELAAVDEWPDDHPLLRRLQGWRALADAGDFERLFGRILDDSGVIRRELFAGRGERQVTNYMHLFELLGHAAAAHRTTLRELCTMLGAWINGSRRPPGLDADVQRLETEADAVQIMTIHQAKGLEAPVVFVYGGLWGHPGGDVRAFHDDGALVLRIGPPPEDEKALYDAEQNHEERRVLYVAMTRARARLYLPRYPLQPVFDCRGGYRFVNERLHALLEGFTAPTTRSLFEEETLVCGPAPEVNRDAGARTAGALADWRPDPTLLVPGDDRRFRVAAESRAGFFITSYSASKRSTAASEDAPGAADERPWTTSPVTSHVTASLLNDALPPGRETGRLLHELLERVPLATLAHEAPPSWQEWLAIPRVRGTFEAVARRHGRPDAATIAAAAQLLHPALARPLPVGAAGRVTVAHAAHPHGRRELEFLFPLPEAQHPLWSRTVGPDEPRVFPIGRGLVKGFIDLLFEHAGRLYVCDWKSDVVDDNSATALVARCDRAYDLQKRLYTLAALRLAGIADQAAFEARFGAVLFVFLRGLDAAAPDAGVAVFEPTWRDVVTWESELLPSAASEGSDA